MDIKTQFIDTIMQSLVGISTTSRDLVEQVLLAELQHYELQERSTELVVSDNSNQGFLKKFLATKRLEGKSEKTINKYYSDINKFLLCLDKPLYEVTTFDLRYYLSVYKEKRHISNRTLENIRKVLASFFGWLHDEGLIGCNPTRSLKHIKYPHVVRHAFSNIERERLKNACTSIRDLALIEFLYASGLRVSEVVSLNRNQIDFTLKQATVIGKGNKERSFYLSDICLDYLQQYLNTRTDNNPALFVSIRAPYNRLGKEGIESLTKRIGKLAGVNNVHPHRFRRTLATDLVKKHVPIQDVAAILGHADLRTTQVYVCLDQTSIQYHYNCAVA